MRWPLMAESMSTISSRLMKPYRMGVMPPMSSARKPIIRLWLKTRFSSTTSARMYSARFGAVIPNSFSKAIAGACSLCIEER